MSDWLLVFDNLENLDYLKKYCPNSADIWGKGIVIITTRNENIENVGYLDGSTIKVDELEEDEKKALFKNILAKEVNKKELDDFLKHIPSYPLDVSSAAYYMKNSHTDFKTYLEKANNITEEFLNTNEKILYEGTVYNKTRYGIVSSTFSEIIKKNDKFKELLFLICLFDSQGIPVDFLKKISKPDIVDSFVIFLKQYSLITCDKNKIYIHRSTQHAGLNYLLREIPKQEKEAFIGKILGFLTPYDHIDSLYKDSIILIPHIQSFAENIKTISDNTAHEILLSLTLGYLFKNKGQSAIYSLQYFDDALSLNEKTNYLSKLEILKTLLSAGEACVNSSENEKAMKYLERSFISQKYSGKNPIEYATNYNLVGTAYMRKNNPLEANKNFDAAIKILDSVDENAEVRLSKAISYSNKGIACYLYNINKPSMRDSIPIFDMAIKLLEKNLEQNNESTKRKSITALINVKCRLGNVYNFLKEYKNALTIKNEAEELMKLCHEDDHNTFRNIGFINLEKAHANLRLNNLEEAAKYFATAKRIFDKAMIGDHWTRLRMQETETLIRIDKLEEAYKNCQDVFNLKSRDVNHYNDICFNTCHYHAAVIKYKQGKISESLEHFKCYVTGMKEFCKRFLPAERYKYLEDNFAFDIITSKSEIKKCFENSLKIFTEICLKGTEFIPDYVEKNCIK